MIYATFQGRPTPRTDEGDKGQCLVFVHGFACDHSDWQRQIDALTADYRCLSVDLRGHGRSSAMGGPYDMATLGADVADVMRAHNITSAVLIGHSMGTRVITEALSAAPNIVRGLVFVDGSQLGQGDPEVARATINKIIDRLGYTQVMQVNFTAMFTDATDPAIREPLVERACGMPEAVGRQLWAEMVTYDAARSEDAYSKIKVPLLVMQSSTVETGGRRRSLQPDETRTPYLDMLCKRVPHAQVVLAPQVGHFIQIDDPELVSKSIRSLARQSLSA